MDHYALNSEIKVAFSSIKERGRRVSSRIHFIYPAGIEDRI